jgi:hypothetical protein
MRHRACILKIRITAVAVLFGAGAALAPAPAAIPDYESAGTR